MWVAVQKLLAFFSAKQIRILYIESAKTVNGMTLNELVKLTTLWTTGPSWNQREKETLETNMSALKILITLHSGTNFITIGYKLRQLMTFKDFKTIVSDFEYLMSCKRFNLSHNDLSDRKAIFKKAQYSESLLQRQHLFPKTCH